MFWCAIRVAMSDAGTFVEATTTPFGWYEPLFQTWYIADGSAALPRPEIDVPAAKRLTVALIV